MRNALANAPTWPSTRRTSTRTTSRCRNLRNQTLPELDLIGTYNLEGRGGTEFQRERFGGAIINRFPGGYSDALANIGDFDAPTWTCG